MSLKNASSIQFKIFILIVLRTILRPGAKSKKEFRDFEHAFTLRTYKNPGNN